MYSMMQTFLCMNSPFSGWFIQTSMQNLESLAQKIDYTGYEREHYNTTRSFYVKCKCKNNKNAKTKWPPKNKMAAKSKN